jgi:tRNA G46 methylase TrmB
MTRLFEVLRSRFEFDETSWFMDLGHGMGRPSMHAAALHPHIKGAFGTEFNPQPVIGLFPRALSILCARTMRQLCP